MLFIYFSNVLAADPCEQVVSDPDQYRWGLGMRLTTTRCSIVKNEAAIDGETPTNTFSSFILVLIVLLHSVSLRTLNYIMFIMFIKSVFLLTWHCNEKQHWSPQWIQGHNEGVEIPQSKMPECLERSHYAHTLAHHKQIHYIEEDKTFIGPKFFCSLNIKYRILWLLSGKRSSKVQSCWVLSLVLACWSLPCVGRLLLRWVL